MFWPFSFRSNGAQHHDTGDQSRPDRGCAVANHRILGGGGQGQQEYSVVGS